MLNARTPSRMRPPMRAPLRARIRARALPAPDLNKCTFIAAMVAGAIMIAIGLMIG